MIDLRIDIRKDPNIQKLPEDIQTKLFDFIESIPKVKFFKPDGKPKKEWKVFYDDTWSSARIYARKSTWVSAKDSARDSARVSAWISAYDSARTSAWYSARTSAWDSARNSTWVSAKDSARDSARVSAWISAKDSARVSAWYSAKDSARDSANDFGLKAQQIVVSDLDYRDKVKHERHVDARIEVWKKGYGLLCDVNGVLYVYAKKGTKPLLS